MFVRIQKRVKDRKIVKAHAHKSIRKAIERLAIQHDCSLSFVTDTLLARQLNIDIEEAYDKHVRPSQKRTGKVAHYRRVS